MEKGEIDIDTKLERIMRLDIADYIKANTGVPDDDIEPLLIKEMKRTKKRTTCCELTKDYFNVFGQLLVTYSEWLCYFCMILSQCINAGLVSLIYPFAVLGYALMEETRPSKNFWYVMLGYTELLIFVKFVC